MATSRLLCSGIATQASELGLCLSCPGHCWQWGAGFSCFNALVRSPLVPDCPRTGALLLHIPVAHSSLSNLHEGIFLSVPALSSGWELWPVGVATLHRLPTFPHRPLHFTVFPLNGHSLVCGVGKPFLAAPFAPGGLPFSWPAPRRGEEAVAAPAALLRAGGLQRWDMSIREVRHGQFHSALLLLVSRGGCGTVWRDCMLAVGSRSLGKSGAHSVCRMCYYI